MTDREILSQILEMGITLSSERDSSKLLTIIVDKSMELTNCDAATLYIMKDRKLHFMVSRNETFSERKDGNIDLPPVTLSTDNVCSYCAITKSTINIEDVYNDTTFSWDGPKKYDAMTGYHTQSMCVIPLINNDDEVIGVLQLLNAQDENGKIIGFSKELEHIVASLASQAAMTMSNMLLTQDIEDLLDSFVDSLVTAIDSRTPYNANHSRNVAKLCKGFLVFLKETGKHPVSDNMIEQLYMAAMVHDVGKMIIPVTVLDKATRLENCLPMMKLRIDLLKEKCEHLHDAGSIDDQAYSDSCARIAEYEKLISDVNSGSFIGDDVIAKIDEFRSMDIGGIAFMNDDEYNNLTIRKGSLNSSERKIVEDHAVYSANILEKIHFGKKYNEVLDHASRHHEYLDGTGYPHGLTKKDLPFSTRVLTMMDVFESLSAARPYKKGLPYPKCYNILCAMVLEGKLDADIVDDFGEYLKKENMI